MKKRVFVNLVIAVLAISMLFAGCAANNGDTSQDQNSVEPSESPVSTDDNAPSDEPTSGDSYSYFVNPKSIGPAYWDAAGKGVTKAGEDLGVEVVFNAPTEADSAKQINMINDMLTRQVNGIAISPNDAKAVQQVFTKASDAGVQVVTWDSDAPDTDRKYYIGPATDKQVAEELVDMLVEQMGDSGQIAFMVAGLGAENQIAKMEAAKAKLEAEYPNIEVVTTVASNDDQQVSFSNAQNLISAYPDLTGILGFAGGEPPAAAEAIEQAVEAGTLEEGQITVTGIVVPSLAKDYLENGTLNEILIWDPSKLGYATVYVMHELNLGHEITDGMEIPYVGKVIVDGDNIFIGTVRVNAENVNDFDF